jgi:MoaA/NifB/PqqE/SkfB family radical SAM enzyme
MWLSMNTNAGAKDVKWWRQLAKVFGRMGTVIFSVDGLRDTNHLYRQNVVWDNVERNMRAFVEAGGRARWDYIIFGHNEHQVDEAEALADSWGVERFQKKKSGRFFSANSATKDTHQAQNRKGSETQLISKPVKLDNQNLALLKQKEIAKTYGGMENYYNSCTIKCKVAEEKNIFITAEGLLMPCCWTAGRMYKWWHQDPKVEQIWDFIDRAGSKQGIDVINNDLQQVMQGSLLKDIENSWDLSSIEQGKLGVCAQKCGTEFDPFGAQFQ